MLPPDRRADLDAWCRERIGAPEDRPRLALGRAGKELENLRASAGTDDADLHREIDEFFSGIASLERRT
ncbi:MAG TPA: hypothetical protein VGT78_09000 [Rhizomicrobium sp.]|nr:hypothetical protein [Rhizomicrobium sp.]